MCDSCDSVSVNTYLAGRWAKQYEARGAQSSGFLRTRVAPDELHGVLTAVYHGNEGHAFFGGAGVDTYQDLVARLSELAVSH